MSKMGRDASELSVYSMSKSQLVNLLMKSQSKAVRDFLHNVDTASVVSALGARDELPVNLDKFPADALVEDVHCLLSVAGLDLYFNEPPLPVDVPLERREEEDRGQPPLLKTQGVSEVLESVFHPAATLLAGYESERPEEMPFYRKPSRTGVWSLQELGMEALGGLLKRTDDKYNSFLNVRFIPPPLQDSFQQILPIDIPIIKAAIAIDEGVFWKRLIEHHYPYIYCNPKLEKTTYKSVFLQRWLADYLSELEPGNISYNDVRKNALAVSLWVMDLDINGLKPPKFRSAYPPKRKLPEKEWNALKKETCLVVNPYPDKLNIREVLKCLANLRNLSLCYGFENYERFPTFRHTRVSAGDILSLGTGLLFCRRLISLRIHKSAIYSQDTIALCQSLIHIPIKKLEISSCFMDDSGVLAVADLLRHHKFLEVLDLSRNKMSENGAYYLAAALIEEGITPLRSLNISFNKVGNIGGLHMGLMLSLNVTLGALSLAGCELGPAGGRVIGTGLSVNRLLLRLDLTGNPLGEGVKAVEAGARAHPRLEKVCLRGAEVADVERRHRAFNRSYAALKALGGGERYRLADVRAARLREDPFPSYSCPPEDGSPSDTQSEHTEPAGYDEDPVLTRYVGEFRQEDDQGKARRVYSKYLRKKADCAVRKGLRELYKKGTPLMKLLNCQDTNEKTDKIYEY